MHSLYTDGGARKNPGPAAYGAILLDDQQQPVDLVAAYLGEDTNNAAEYAGLVAGLELAIEYKVKELKCYLDSELIVMQVNGAYRVKQKHLKEQWERVEAMKDQFDSIKFVHIRRAKNKIADKLVNIVLDAKAGA